MSFAPLQRLVERWRQEADLLRRRGAEVQGGLLDCAADEVEAALHGHESEALTLSQSADESGYSADHLGRMVRDGKIPNAGEKNAPRILRRDLPRKAPLSPTTPVHELSREQIVRSVTTTGVR